MKFAFQTLLFCLSLMLTSCAGNKAAGEKDISDPNSTTDSIPPTEQTVTVAIIPELLVNCWAHSFEEQAPATQEVFYSCATHTFPAARYRNTFVLNGDKTAEYSMLSPTDAHTTEKGTWTYDAAKKSFSILNAKGEVVRTYPILELQADKLVVSSL